MVEVVGMGVRVDSGFGVSVGTLTSSLIEAAGEAVILRSAVGEGVTVSIPDELRDEATV